MSVPQPPRSITAILARMNYENTVELTFYPVQEETPDLCCATRDCQNLNKYLCNFCDTCIDEMEKIKKYNSDCNDCNEYNDYDSFDTRNHRQRQIKLTNIKNNRENTKNKCKHKKVKNNKYGSMYDISL